MMNDRHVTAMVIARGGSKGLPGKALRPLLGRPAVAYSVDHAFAAECVDLVAISTDDARIAAAARQAVPPRRRLHLVQRPAELADDTARVDDALRHAVRTLEAEGASLDILVVLYGNVPVRAPGLIGQAVGMMVRTGCDSVQSFAPVGKFHPWWMYKMDADGRVRFQDDHKVYRRQELPPLFMPDAAAIVLRRDVLMASESQPDEPHALFGADRRGIVQPADASVDIDTELDLFVAEAMLRKQGSGVRG
ncbi:MAG: N-acylneuraminate cytidylyltransferase [Phycisphaerae bacterium]|nr:N-acylneuraminate cytidylyltransferase [Phycisphaerae bacterium]